jgi:hypothetical protein
MSPHRAAYATSCIKPQTRAHPDIRPAIRNVGIKPKLRAFTDIDALNHYTLTPQTRAHPDIGPSRISKINGLASAAEAGSCKKCRVTGKYYVPVARSFTATHTHGPGPLLHVKQRDCTHHRNCRHHHRFEHRRLTRSGRKRDTDTETEITIMPPRAWRPGIHTIDRTN